MDALNVEQVLLNNSEPPASFVIRSRSAAGQFLAAVRGPDAMRTNPSLVFGLVSPMGNPTVGISAMDYARIEVGVDDDGNPLSIDTKRIQRSAEPSVLQFVRDEMGDEVVRMAEFQLSPAGQRLARRMGADDDQIGVTLKAANLMKRFMRPGEGSDVLPDLK
jgi:hypothetical protein